LILITSHETTEFVFPKAHPKMYKGDACVKFNDGITNGAAWYVIDGGMQDWSYAYTSDMEVTIELGCNKYPDQTDLKSYWDDNKGALLAYITQVFIESLINKEKNFGFSFECRLFMVFVVLYLIQKQKYLYQVLLFM
jgi:hypothetical protein